MGIDIEQENTYLAEAKRLAEQFALDAAERDRAGGTPKAQRDALRESGLLSLLIPREYGGRGQTWSTALRVVREIAKTDASVAHLFGYHCLYIGIFYIVASEEQKRKYFTETVRNRWFWGNTSNPLDKGLLGKKEGDRYVLNGRKSFGSGSPDSDLLVITWLEDAEEAASDQYVGTYRSAIIPSDRAGVTINDDWDHMGQRQTGSGTVSYRDVEVLPEEIILAERAAGSAFVTIVPILSQSVLAQLFTGSAIGALEAAKQYTRTSTRPWINAGVENATQDPYILRDYGDFWVQIEAAEAIVDRALIRLDALWSKELAITELERGECAVYVAAANVYAGRVALDVTSRIFETMGARSGAAKYGFDRFWRNVRTHTLHNPSHYKLRTVGDWVLNGNAPKPTDYS